MELVQPPGPGLLRSNPIPLKPFAQLESSYSRNGQSSSSEESVGTRNFNGELVWKIVSVIVSAGKPKETSGICCGYEVPKLDTKTPSGLVNPRNPPFELNLKF